MKLSEAQVKNFIGAQPDLAAIASKIQAAGDKPDPALQTELEGIAKKHGFADFTELDDVAANISIVMAGLDSQTGTFTDPVEALQKELEDVKKEFSNLKNMNMNPIEPVKKDAGAAEARKQEDDFKKLFGETAEEPKPPSAQAAS